MSAVGSPAADGGNAVSTEVNYKFCQECSNLLYPKETRSGDGWVLTYFCKACHHVESSNPSCTFRRELGNNVTETAGVTTDVANDPTVSGPTWSIGL
jgi:DNA-directed RNA polymerase II subunit RPB9